MFSFYNFDEVVSFVRFSLFYFISSGTKIYLHALRLPRLGKLNSVLVSQCKENKTQQLLVSVVFLAARIS